MYSNINRLIDLVMIVVNHDPLTSDIVYDLVLVSLLSDVERKIFISHCQQKIYYFYRKID